MIVAMNDTTSRLKPQLEWLKDESPSDRPLESVILLETSGAFANDVWGQPFKAGPSLGDSSHPGRTVAVATGPHAESAPLPGPTYPIAREPFYIEVEADIFYVRHPRWSLVGSGRSILEAKEDLLAEGREVAEVILSLPVDSLDTEMLALREFLFRIL